MADRFYGMDRGSDRATTSATVQNLDVELVVDDAVGLHKKDIVIALDRIKQAVLEDEGFTEGG